MKTPADEFKCEDYLQSEYAKTGMWDEDAQLWVVLPLGEVEVLDEASLMVVGRPGVDGIVFGYRSNETGLWAYHPIDREFQWLAGGIHELIEGWHSGRISL